MAQVGLKILIVEDDAALGETLRDSLTRKGHFPFHVTKPDDALQMVARQSFDLFLLDCLLPNMTGIDLCKKIKDESTFSRESKIVLMSGIYTDKAFQQDSIQDTGAHGFLKKPFKLEELDVYLAMIKTKKPQVETSPRKQLYEIFEKEKVSPLEKIKLIESLEEVDGYDLPFIYSLLAETKSSGHLNIFNSTGSVSGVSFSDGSIVGVDVDDKSTNLGHMLIQSGYLAADDLQEVLKDNSPRKIGQKLIESCKLSPHAFDMILSEQMNVRLTRTIVEGKVKVNFVATEVEPVASAIDSETLLRYLHDWVASKLPLTWLESLYLMWSGQKILKSSGWKEDHPVFETSFIKRLEKFPKKFANPITLNELLGIEGYDATSVHKAMHLMLLKGLIIFSSEKTNFDATSQRQHLKKIQSQIDGKNSEEVLELFQELLRGKPDNTWIDEFMKFVGPAPQDSEVLKIWSSVRDRFDKAIRVQWEQSNEEVSQIKHKEKTEMRLSGIQKLDEVKAQLQLNQYQKAAVIFNKIKYVEDLPGGRSYRIWIQLGTLEPKSRIAQLKEVELELMQIPPDERYDALYLFVVGLYQKAKGDTISARKSFEKSLAINPSFIIAKRELAVIDTVVRKPNQDIFNMDLKDVIGRFFKKNKTG